LAQRHPAGLFFGRPDGRPFSNQSLSQRAARTWRSAGLEPVGLHECRHTFASLMIAAGVNVKALSTFVGHSSVRTTLDRYGHLFPGAESEAASLLDRYLERRASDLTSRYEQSLPMNQPRAPGAVAQDRPIPVL
jgi:integrase